MIAGNYHYVVVVSKTLRGSYARSFDWYDKAGAMAFYDSQRKQGREVSPPFRALGPCPKQDGRGWRKDDAKGDGS